MQPVANAVANESTSANLSVPSAYSSGEMTYNVSANIAAMQGDISFSYKNYSEFSDGRMVIVSGHSPHFLQRKRRRILILKAGGMHFGRTRMSALIFLQEALSCAEDLQPEGDSQGE